MGIVHWRVRRDAGAEYGTVRRLDHYYSQLFLAAVSACRRHPVITISWEGPWNTRVFHCGRPSGIGEPLTGGNSRWPDVPLAICVGYYMDVFSAALCRGLARDLVSGGVQWYCIRARRSRDRPDVHRYRRNDSAHRCSRPSDRARRHPVGKFQFISAYVEPGNGHRSQTNLDCHRRQSLRGPARSDRNTADRNLLPPARPYSPHAGGSVWGYQPIRIAFRFWNQPGIGLCEFPSSFR